MILCAWVCGWIALRWSEDGIYLPTEKYTEIPYAVLYCNGSSTFGLHKIFTLRVGQDRVWNFCVCTNLLYKLYVFVYAVNCRNIENMP